MTGTVHINSLTNTMGYNRRAGGTTDETDPPG